MNLERTLVVDSVFPVAQDVISIKFVAPDRSPLARWDPGAHLELRLASGLIRHYSLCGDPERLESYTVMVLREPTGRGGSIEIHETIAPGQEYQIRGPRNNFGLVDAEHFLFLAGGIGITPIAAMVREVDRRHADWQLVYGGRSLASMALADELHAISPGRVKLVPQDECGLPNLAVAFDRCSADTQVYCCGPEGLLAAAGELASQRSLSLHVERFGGADTSVAPPADSTAFEVELAASGIVLTVPPDRTILECVLDVLPQTAFSCMEGNCGSCEVKVLSGIPDHRDEVLTEEEREANSTMMICVGRSHSPRLVIDL